MKKLSNVPVPDDFELGVFTRTSLSQLPVAPVPDSFENTVLRKARSTGGVKWFVVGAGMALLIAISSIVYRVATPDVVAVTRVPTYELQTVNLENLQPAPAFEYKTDKASTGRSSTDPKSRNHVPVAGY